ncbi:MAG: hypothetical protein ACOC97_02090 [Myxococcota bacterium]
MWSELSPLVKAVVVIGAIGIVVALVFMLGDFGGTDEDVVQERGLQPAPAAEAAE